MGRSQAGVHVHVFRWLCNAFFDRAQAGEMHHIGDIGKSAGAIGFPADIALDYLDPLGVGREERGDVLFGGATEVVENAHGVARNGEAEREPRADIARSAGDKIVVYMPIIAHHMRLSADGRSFPRVFAGSFAQRRPS